MSSRFVVLAAASWLALAPAARAEQLVVLGSSRIPIVEGRKLDARGQALSSALHNALYKAVAKLLDLDSSDLSDDQIEEIETALGPPILEFIVERQIVRDEPGTDEYILQTRVTFDRERLHAAMLKAGIAKRASEHFWERVMIVITEDHRFTQSSVQTELTRNFVEQGYRVVDQTQLEAIRQLDQGAALARGDANAATAIGRKFGAEIVIFGDAIIEPLPKTNAGFARRAGVNVQMLRTDTGQIFAANEMARSGTDQSPELAGRRACATAAEALGRYLLDQLDKQAQAEVRKPRMVETVITGISYARYAMLKKAIGDGIAGVQKYHARDYQEQALRAEVDIEFMGPAENLADALATYRFDDFRLTVSKVTPNRIDFHISPR